MKGIAVILALFVFIRAHSSTEIKANGRQKQVADIATMSPSDQTTEDVTGGEHTTDAPLKPDINVALEEEKNRTCIRQDFEDYATAIFEQLDGGSLDVDDSYLRFNSSIGPESLLSTEDFKGLKLLNQTDVDCNDYPSNFVPFALSPGALASLSG